MGSLLLVVYALINPPVVPAHSAIDTPGRWVVVVSWPMSDNDVDTWLRTPDGRLVWWQAMRSPVAHLEQDDTGVFGDADGSVNGERMVIRNVIPGEYVVNLHCYVCRSDPVLVTVTLWRLQGADQKIYSVQVRLVHRQEATAFRFSLDADGRLTDTNRLPASLVWGDG